MSTHVSATNDSKQLLKADLRTAEILKPEETSQTLQGLQDKSNTRVGLWVQYSKVFKLYF